MNQNYGFLYYVAKAFKTCCKAITVFAALGAVAYLSRCVKTGPEDLCCGIIAACIMSIGVMFNAFCEYFEQELAED